MTQQLGNMSLSFERIEAIHGVALPEWLRPYFLNDRAEIASRLRAGEIGCYASHLVAMTRIAASAEPGLVMEDDVSIPEDFGQIIHAIHNLPRGWDIVRLSNDFNRGFVPVKSLVGRYQSVKFCRIPTSSGAYLITPDAASRFLSWKTLRTIPIDHDLRQPWNCKLVTYGVHPQPVTHPEGESSIRSMGDKTWWRPQKGWTDMIGLKNNIARTAYNVQWLGLRQSLKIALRSRSSS